MRLQIQAFVNHQANKLGEEGYIKDLRIHEGLGMICDYPNELLKLDKLTRITRVVLQSYINEFGKI